MIAQIPLLHRDIVTLLSGAYSALRHSREGRSIVSSYAHLPDHVLADIGLDVSDVHRAGAHPSDAAQELAASWKRRANMLARRDLPAIEDDEPRGGRPHLRLVKTDD